MSDMKLLQASYWITAIADFIYAIIILMPSRAGVSEYVYPMGLFAAVAFSWGIMLIFANKKPLERRWILIPTIIVITIISIANVYSYVIGAIDLNLIVPRVVLGLGIIAFISFSYWKTR
ncbi:MAG: hypothetical protein PVH84_07635 [Candidatus Aminicenantes bacterium]|jgi:hypothetical protein